MIADITEAVETSSNTERTDGDSLSPVAQLQVASLTGQECLQLAKENSARDRRTRGAAEEDGA